MAIINPVLKPFVLNATDIQFLLDQVKFKPLFDLAGNAIINWDGTGIVYNAYGAVIGTGGLVVGDAASLAAITAYGSSYQNITDLAGLRDPSGFNNNLTLVHAHWGQAGYDFPRTAQAIYDKYSKEIILPADTTFSALPLVTTPATFVTTENVLTSSMSGPSSSTSNNITVSKIVTEKIGVATVVAQGSTVATSVSDGHHARVNLIDTITTNSTTTSTYLFDKLTTTTTITDDLHPASTATTTNSQTTQTAPVQQGPTVNSTDPTVRTLSGGELDTTTMIDGHAAHTFKGAVSTGVGLVGAYGTITNGVTTVANYANPWDSVVDYTPRMISRVTTTAGVTYDTWANHAGDVGAANHVPTEIYYDAKGVAKVLDWGLLKTVADGGLGQVDTQARLDASAGKNDHFIGGLNPGVSPSNGFFVLFGQFFDHGLDFIDKGGQGSVIKIALAVDDPLYGMLGPDGRPVTSITINRATVDHMDANGTPQYANHTSPFIDQSQTYGSTSQVTNLLREWVSDTTTVAPGDYHAGMNMLDGHTLATTWVNGHGQTVNDTLPTLNELRAHILATGRDGLTWEDVSNLRNRDASGHIATGLDAGTSGSALILDSNPRFDDVHLLNGTPAQDAVVNSAISTLDAAVKTQFGIGSYLQIDPTSHKLTLFIENLPPGPPPSTPHTLTGASALYPWVNFSNFSIIAPAGAVHDAVGEILMASVGDHYIAGDGRVNENFGLTSIHHIFHEEHNFQVQNLVEALHTQDIATGDTNHVKLHEFQIDLGFGTDPVTHDYVDAAGKASWDTDKMFNATKLIVEMEYQHAAVDQYARNVTPNIQEFVGYSPDKNPGVSLEYAQGAFRFGHSTLRETIDTIDPTHGLTGKIMGYALRDAFLNPDKYAEIGPASILLGMSHQQMNGVDEFVTPALNQGLLGQPLDLASINIARGRDIGLPTLNDFRQALGLARYTSWTDFGQNMQHPQSLGNFIAAYSLDGNVAKGAAIVGLAAGMILDGAVEALGMTAKTALAFLNGGDLGFNLIDTWLGGLAEIPQPGGLLGETFDKVFVNQIESLMDGDRFYYLYRLAGQQFSEEVGNGQLKDIVERNSGLTHLNGNIFGYADQYVDLGAKKEVVAIGAEAQTTGNEHKYGDDLAVAAGTKGIYSNGGLGNANDGTDITLSSTVTVDSNGVLHSTTTSQTYLQDTRLADATPGSAFVQNGGVNLDGTPNSGAESSEVIVGSAGNDLIYAQGGDDTVYGDGGNDIIYGGYGIDRLYGGAGNDVIYGGDNPDLIDGGAGDDILFGESSGSDINGADQIIGGSGNDYIDGGIGIDKLSGGSGDDHILGGQDTDPFTHGSDGNDWVEGNSGGDILYGDNGDDLVVGGADQDQLFGGLGDDILRPGDPTGALTIGTDEVLGNDGTDVNDTGFDIIDFSDTTLRINGVTFDLGNQTNPSVTVNGTPTQVQSFQMDAVIGSVGNDTLTGDDATSAGAGADASIAGNNWLIGGSGSDLLTGSGGNDIIIGGSIHLDQLIGKYESAAGVLSTYNHNNNNDGLTAADILQDARYQGASHRVGYLDQLATSGVNSGFIDAANALGGVQFDKHFTEMLRSDQFKNLVLGDGGSSAGDTAMFTDDFANYTIDVVTAANGLIGLKIAGNTGTAAAADGTDLVYGVDNLNFNGVVYKSAALFNAGPSITSDGGGATAALARAENGTAVTTVVAVDKTPGALVYSLVGGADMALFQIHQLTGVLTFLNAPNFEAPADVGVNNIYDVIVQVTDVNNKIDTQAIAVTVTNVNEPSTGGIDISSTLFTLTGTNSVTVNALSTLADPDLPAGVNPTYVWTRDSGNAAFTGGTTASMVVTGGTQTSYFHLSGSYADPFGTYSFTAPETLVVGNDQDQNGAFPNGNASILGTAGNDIIFGLGGDDTMRGGAGDDVYIVNSAADVVDERVINVVAGFQFAVPGSDAGGTDTVKTSVTYTLAASTARGSIENLVLTGAANINGTGNNLDNVITGNVGNNNLNGAGGNDTINAGGGDDNITYAVSGAANASGFDLIDGGANGTPAGDRFILNGLAGIAETFSIYSNTDDWDGAGAGTGSSAAHAGFSSTSAIVVARNGVMIAGLTNIEEITINGSAITVPEIPATAGGDTIQVVGNFDLTGLNFNTITVNGGAGNDTVDITGLTSDHRIVFNTGTGTDTVLGTVRAQDVVNMGATVAVDATTSSANGDTSNQGHTTDVEDDADESGHTPPPAPVVDQTLIGDETANLLSGAGGDDVALGKGGDDLISTGDGADFINAGAGADTVVAGAGDDMVYGQDGADTMFGGAGRDMIDGGNGDDTVFGGSEDDMFVAHANDGSDSYHGDTGSDTLDMSAVMTNIEVNLGTGLAGWAKTGTVTDQLYSIENVVTGSGNDTITASGAHNVIDTGAGHDKVVFHAASDANGDTILNFEAGDKIDVSGFMSGTINLVNGPTAAAGQIAISFENIAGENFTVLHGHDVNDNEFQIDIKGHHALTGTDFAA